MTQTKETTQEKALKLQISVKGEIVQSNFEEFKNRAMDRIESINYELVTDDHFGQAKLDIASLKDFESTLSEAEEAMLREMDDVYALITGSRELKEISATARKDLNAKVTARQREIKEEMLQNGLKALEVDHPGFRLELETAIKGKRSLVKMQEAIDDAVDEFNDQCLRNSALIETADEAYGASVVFGAHDLVIMETEALKIELERRVERHRDALEKARLREEAEKAKALVEQASPKEETPSPPPAAPAPQQVAPSPQASPPSPNGDGITAQEEMERFLGIVRQAFAPVKEARGGLRHQENIQRAERFAEDLREAWGRFNA